MNKEKILIACLTILIAFMDVTGIPCSLLFNIQINDIEPIYFSLMINFILIGIISYFYLKLLCPKWEIGFGKVRFLTKFKKYYIIGIIISFIGFVAFLVGLLPFDNHPSIAKVIIEGIVYYIGVAIIEEFYIRGLLLNLIEIIFAKKKNCTLIAVISSAVIFGIGHIFGTLNQPIIVIISKVIWTIGMGVFLGMVYKQTKNLWVPIIFHFLINIGALPYQFSTIKGYTNITLYIIVPAYIILGIYSICELQKCKNHPGDIVY